MMCVSSICIGGVSVIAVKLLVRVVEIRVEAGLPIMPFERGLFAFVCVLIIMGAVIYPMLCFIALRGLLREAKRGEDSRSSLQEPRAKK